MYRKKDGIDIIGKVLDALYEHNKDALFVMSLMHQYEERGSLSKKQLEGLYQKALKVKTIPPSWLGTLQAIILRMPTRYKPTEPVVKKPVFEKDPETGRMIDAVLAVYPQHKRVLYLKTRYEDNSLGRLEADELKKFCNLPGVTYCSVKDAGNS